jgi:ribosomal small subunit protein bTHX
LYEYITKIPMGKGDRKTRRGKIIKGTYGVSRPKKSKGSDNGAPAAKAASAEKSPPKRRTRKPAAEAKPKAAAAKTSKSATKSAKTADKEKKSEK